MTNPHRGHTPGQEGFNGATAVRTWMTAVELSCELAPTSDWSRERVVRDGTSAHRTWIVCRRFS
jgi:hypothetical protein